MHIAVCCKHLRRRCYSLAVFCAGEGRLTAETLLQESVRGIAGSQHSMTLRARPASFALAYLSWIAARRANGILVANGDVTPSLPKTLPDLSPFCVDSTALFPNFLPAHKQKFVGKKDRPDKTL
jgi:hypothetical protein